MHFTTAEIAAATDGTASGTDVTVSGASIDSRILEPGQLFVPIVAERDGHDFLPAALSAGAPAYLTSRDDTPPPDGVAAIRVADTALALRALGRAARARIGERVVGVTGSVGKTSTKDLLAGVLQTTYRTAASAKSFNNELGLPLTLFGADDGTEAAVLEMGARGVGHIATLCAIAAPTVGVLTRVEAVHLENFGSLDAVAQTKGELVESLPDSGIAVLNADDPNVAAMASRTSARVLTYSAAGAPADLTAGDVILDDQLRASFTLHSPWGTVPVRLGARGEHQVGNALAAAAAGAALGVDLEQVAAGLYGAALSGLRMELAQTASGFTVINDAYNANPTSMAAALKALAQLDAPARVAVLGTMAELGEDSDAAHRGVAELASSLGIAVIAVDEPSYGDGAQHVTDAAAAAERVTALGAPLAVLVKGSRVAALERVAELLA
ncbi:UDP-N-acetylmuramoyl-tripeptide--D-alanyl-D-alanine ligase [Gordonia araii NBRC 100433]|uniref:UDP-N-acetylmuramoyl-tripeptide--D-alanyl-D-alanine ligase n=1 Tax=Gordonia araii NBRC 100433 TaxID=1073574 RepID=G7GXJ6_9ACTN|nr:UDP-N-acetylmuramoyl-tripeptide--D-alanyl-D-alanine ligase [Gordonia araii]NNG98240.1 UDP-N-acetylmuramoyl-tripeptide--D-alanyl-D-alanine ligase [Gordonia araii NBRC 100433]GAB08321.1 UDP-N-acetylmuramoyl-tripeptide--D-alanyl-D-alanine ligase [Gordonia araii NBRC 100433]